MELNPCMPNSLNHWHPHFRTKKLWEAESGCFDESSKHGLVNNVLPRSSSILRYPLAILHALVFLS